MEGEGGKEKEKIRGGGREVRGEENEGRGRHGFWGMDWIPPGKGEGEGEAEEGKGRTPNV